MKAQTLTGTATGGMAGLTTASKAANVIAYLAGLPAAMPSEVLDDTKFLIAGAVGIVLTVAGGYAGRLFAPVDDVEGKTDA